MEALTPIGAFEPSRWNIVFHMKTTIWWLRWLGRFKHVSAFAYVPGAKLWVVYDVQITGTRLMFFSHAEWIGGVVQDWTRDSEIVTLDRRLDDKNKIASRFFFFCGPAIKHLLGIGGRALRPDAIYREVLRNGGSPLAKNPGHSGRPEPRD